MIFFRTISFICALGSSYKLSHAKHSSSGLRTKARPGNFRNSRQSCEIGGGGDSPRSNRQKISRKKKLDVWEIKAS